MLSYPIIKAIFLKKIKLYNNQIKEILADVWIKKDEFGHVRIRVPRRSKKSIMSSKGTLPSHFQTTCAPTPVQYFDSNGQKVMYMKHVENHVIIYLYR